MIPADMGAIRPPERGRLAAVTQRLRWGRLTTKKAGDGEVVALASRLALLAAVRQRSDFPAPTGS
jgi:hypothetical protein